MHRILPLLPLLLVLSGCSPEDAVENLLMWLVFLVAIALLATIGLVVVLMVLLLPPFLGLVSGLLLRRGASARRRMFVIAVGMLNLSNLALFSWPLVSVVESAMVASVSGHPAEVADGIAPESAEDALIYAVGFGVLLLVNLLAGSYSIYAGLTRAPEDP